MTWFFFTMMNHNSFFFIYTCTHAHTDKQANNREKSLFFSLLLDDLYTYTFNLTVIDSRLQRQVSDDLIPGVFMSHSVVSSCADSFMPAEAVPPGQGSSPELRLTRSRRPATLTSPSAWCQRDNRRRKTKDSEVIF